jgi:glycosyltransferase involved in cell wall biosynthesis
MSEFPLVSVIVPCYNSGGTLPRTVESVFKQTWKNLELIIIDDGSTDISTIELLDYFSTLPNVVVHSQRNKGLASARNKGIGISKGEFILPLDSDDWLDDNAIKVMVETHRLVKISCIIFSDIHLEGDRVGVKKTFCNPFEQLFSNQLPYCMLFPKKILNKVNGYDESLVYGLEDWDLNIRLLTNKYTFVKIDKPLFHYWVHNQGMFQSVTSKKFGNIFLSIKDKYPDVYIFSNLLKLVRNSRNIPSHRNLFHYLILSFVQFFMPVSLKNGIFYLLFQINKRLKYKKKIYLNVK